MDKRPRIRDTAGQDQVLSPAAATRPAQLFDAWRDETRASGASGLRETGAAGRRTLHYQLGDSRELLVEDQGILLWLSSATMGNASLDALEIPARAALRDQAAVPKP